MSRFLCFSSGRRAPYDESWSRPSPYSVSLCGERAQRPPPPPLSLSGARGPCRESGLGSPLQDNAGKAKLLDVVEEDVDQRFSRLPPEHRQPDTVPLRRLQRAGLPPAELHLGQELLSKLAAIDAAREAGEAVSPLPASSLHPTAGALAPPRRTRRAPHPKPTLRRRAATGAQAADPGAAQQRGRTPAVRVLPGKGRGARHRQVRAGQPRRPPALPSPRGAPRQPKLAAGEANPTEWGRRTRPSASPPASASVGARP
jgi:hypothetical protein